jgi:site-specific recombinase XerD
VPQEPAPALQPGRRAGDARQSHKLPSATLTHQDAEAVLAIPDVATVIGLRDRAVLELLYATGMRRGELVGLDFADVDLAGAG